MEKNKTNKERNGYVMDKDRMQWTKDTAKNRMHGKMQ